MHRVICLLSILLSVLPMAAQPEHSATPADGAVLRDTISSQKEDGISSQKGSGTSSQKEDGISSQKGSGTSSQKGDGILSLGDSESSVRAMDFGFYSPEEAFRDILETLVENDASVDVEAVEENLYALMQQPIDLNTATTRQLEQLFWLTNEQIEAILLYVYRHPMQSIYELQLIPGLADYEVRNILPFVEVRPAEKTDERILRDYLRYARHEVDMRLDTRNLEAFKGDPVYASIKYQMRASNKFQLGITLKRDAGEHFSAQSRYGAFLQVNDLWRFRTLVMGDFRANFGLGLTMNAALPMGKSPYAASIGVSQQGLHRYSGTSSDFLRGAGVTLALGQRLDLTALYSYRLDPKGTVLSTPYNIRAHAREASWEDAIPEAMCGNGEGSPWGIQYKAPREASREDAFPEAYVAEGEEASSLPQEHMARWPYQQTAALNLLYHHNRVRLGASAVAYWSRDSLRLAHNYYNDRYFRGKRQFATSLYWQYAFRRVMLLGEAAAAENTHWGGALLTAVRYSPVQDVRLIALLRYYSPYYDAHFASTFGETSRPNDEHGIFLSAETSRIHHWRLALYSDFFCFSGPKYMIRDSLTWGYDLHAEAHFLPSARTDMLWRLRVRRKGTKDLYTFRFQYNQHWRQFSLRTQFDANLCRLPSAPLFVLTPERKEALYAPEESFSTNVVAAPMHTASLSSDTNADAGTAYTYADVFTNADTDEPPTYGLMLGEQLEYRAARLPLVAQLRVQGFYIPNYNNRIYAYENDVLYAFAIPMNYGLGARYYLNLRYHISSHFSLYFRISDTWYAHAWASEHNYASAHRTDLHLLLRMKF